MEAVMDETLDQGVDTEIDQEEKELKEALNVLRQKGFSVDWRKKVIRKGREKVYFMSESNLRKMIFFIYDMVLAGG